MPTELAWKHQYQLLESRTFEQKIRTENHKRTLGYPKSTRFFQAYLADGSCGAASLDAFAFASSA